mgnify:CR=1 FL=1
MASLSYDNSGLRAEQIGEDYGISSQRRVRLGSRVESALAAVVEAHEEERLGFLDLPDEDPAGITKWASRKIEARRTAAVLTRGRGATVVLGEGCRGFLLDHRELCGQLAPAAPEQRARGGGDGVPLCARAQHRRQQAGQRLGLG